jgi:hypothetical protein
VAAARNSARINRAAGSGALSATAGATTTSPPTTAPVR